MLRVIHYTADPVTDGAMILSSVTYPDRGMAYTIAKVCSSIDTDDYYGVYADDDGEQLAGFVAGERVL